MDRNFIGGGILLGIGVWMLRVTQSTHNGWVALVGAIIDTFAVVLLYQAWREI